jgi:hypothetical protein
MVVVEDVGGEGAVRGREVPNFFEKDAAVGRDGSTSLKDVFDPGRNASLTISTRSKSESQDWISIVEYSSRCA